MSLTEGLNDGPRNGPGGPDGVEGEYLVGARVESLLPDRVPDTGHNLIDGAVGNSARAS